MASNLFLSLKRCLERSLMLNSQQDFIQALESIKTLDVKYEDISVQLTQAYTKWGFIDRHLVSYLVSKATTGGLQHFEDLCKVLRFVSLIDYPSVTDIIKPIKSQLSFLHPLEITTIQMILLLKGLENARFYSKETLNFITSAILSSNLPSGRLTQELMTQLLKWFSNTEILDETLWKLIQKKLETCRASYFSHENFVSVMHSLSLIDGYSIPGPLVKDLESMNFSTSAEIIKNEALWVSACLRSFKNIEIFNKNLNFQEPLKKSPEEQVKSSNFHKEVEAALNSMKISFKSEQSLLHKNFSTSVDLLLADQLVIEVQGPFHYLHPMRKELQRSVKKRKYLEIQGFSVKSIPYFEWPSSAEQQKRYLESLLK